MALLTLRDYQRRAIDMLYAWMRYNRGNPCIVMPTGSGKAVVCAALCRDIMTKWPQSRILILSHVKELLQQDAEKIMLAWPEAPLGIYSAGMGSRDIGLPITVAGIQSVRDKAEILGFVDITLVDEAHLISHKAEGGYRTLLEALKAKNPNMRIVGLTATPYRLGHGLISEHGAIFDDLIEPVQIAELVARGFLAPLRSKLPGTVLSTEGVGKRGGEYIEHELQAAVNNADDNDRIVDEVIRRAGDRKAWLFFCTGVAHAEAIRNVLHSHGVVAEVVTGATPKAERDRIIADYKAGRIKALTNADVLCLDEETEILTSDGFVGIDDMSPEHLIAAWKEDGSIEFTHPKTIVRRYRKQDEKMVSFNGGMAAPIRVTANHRMVIRCGLKRRSIKVVSAESLIGKRVTIPAFGKSMPWKIKCPQRKFNSNFSRQVIALSYVYRKKGIEIKQARVMAEEYVKKIRSMKYKNPDELTLDECRFIGFWLGDGTKSGGRYSISQSEVYPEIILWAETIFNNIGLHYTKHHYPQRGNMNMPAVRWCFSRGTGGDGQEIEGGIYPYEPYLEKDGTDLLFGFTKEQVEALLEGLWKADGLHYPKNQKYLFITSVWKSFLDTLQAVCSMRGISAVISKQSVPRKNNHRQQYRFSWGGRQSWSYVASSSMLETEFKQERVWCVTSSTSFLICRRRGHVFVTGNTTGFDYPDIDLIALCRPTMSPGLYTQMAGRGMRIAPDKTDCLVLDFAGNVKRHGPITEVRPPKHKGSGTGDAPVKVCGECAELVHTSVKVCPCCGYEFPPAPKEAVKLYDDDIMGLEPEEMRVRGWWWYVRQSKAKQINMLCVDYENAELTGDKVTEYITILHDGYARYRAEMTLRAIMDGCGADISAVNGENENYLDDIAEVFNSAKAPDSITIKKDGRYYRVLKRHWPALGA